MTRTGRRLAFVAFVGMTAGSCFADQTIKAARVADGVYAFVGANVGIAPDNRGFVGNSGFLVGPSGVVVIDTGISTLHGRRMLAAVATITDRPVVLVILTHAVQEFLFGNAAFEERGIPILAHAETAKLMRARCDLCLQTLSPLLGEEFEGTRLVLPGIEVGGGSGLEAGGRKIEILHFGWAHTPGDLAIMDRETGTLFAGGLVEVGRVPEIRDSDFDGWLRALHELGKMPIVRLVPGHGPVSGPEAVSGTRDYLLALDRAMRALYTRNTSLIDALDLADLPTYVAWAMYPVTHRRNAQHRYLQLEIEELGSAPRSTTLPQR